MALLLFNTGKTGHSILNKLHKILNIMNHYFDNPGLASAALTMPEFKRHKRALAVALFTVACIVMIVPSAQAQLDIQLTTIGKAGNAADTTGYGAVDYDYQIGTTAVTNAQYAAFLNSAAKSDPYGLYNTSMNGYYGGITRSGTAGSYTYTVKDDRGDNPVNLVSFLDAARFSNWLTNGANDSASTETGMYTIVQHSIAAYSFVSARNEDAWAAGGYAITSEDEWYKAAYYNLDGEFYTMYATGDTINTTQANYDSSNPNIVADDAYAPEQNGTYGMMGNVQEWNEGSFTEAGVIYRFIRGGAYTSRDYALESGDRSQYTHVGWEYQNTGFRIATLAFVPEPSTYAGIIAALALGFVVLRRRKRVRVIA